MSVRQPNQYMTPDRKEMHYS